MAGSPPDTAKLKSTPQLGLVWRRLPHQSPGVHRRSGQNPSVVELIIIESLPKRQTLFFTCWFSKGETSELVCKLFFPYPRNLVDQDVAPQNAIECFFFRRLIFRKFHSNLVMQLARSVRTFAGTIYNDLPTQNGWFWCSLPLVAG